MNFSSETGTFSTVNGLPINSNEHFTITYQPTDVLLTVVSGALAPLSTVNASSFHSLLPGKVILPGVTKGLFLTTSKAAVKFRHNWQARSGQITRIVALSPTSSTVAKPSLEQKTFTLGKFPIGPRSMSAGRGWEISSLRLPQFSSRVPARAIAYTSGLATRASRNSILTLGRSSSRRTSTGSSLRGRSLAGSLSLPVSKLLSRPMIRFSLE